MNPRKPDRFERASKEKIWFVHERTGVDLVTQAVCAELLRNEHAWMKRMVRGMYAIAEEMELSKQGFKDLLIEQLAQRRK